VGRILALLAILLVLANARCFLRCQLDSDSADRITPPCHSQNHSKTNVAQDHCLEQHDLSVSAAPQTIAAIVPELPSSGFVRSFLVTQRAELSPPSITAGTYSPLRI
jgi:hypothetical protein